MYCPRCDSPVPDGANFCMRCGNPLATKERGTPQPAVATAAAPIAAPIAAPVPARNNQAAPYLAMAAIIAVVFFVGWGISNALQARAQEDPTMMVHHKPKTDLMATTQPTPGMPPAVHDWLEHLRRIEEQKNKLTATQIAQVKTFGAKYQALGPAAGLLSNGGDDEDNTNPAVPVEQMTTDMVGPWNKLIKDYQSVPPPPECQALADEYFAGLNEIPAEMGDVQKLLVNMTQSMSSSNPQSGETDANKDALKKAESMQGQSSEDIDTHFTNSDQMLGDVCAKYSTRKWFSITSDLGSGLLNTPF